MLLLQQRNEKFDEMIPKKKIKNKNRHKLLITCKKNKRLNSINNTNPYVKCSRKQSFRYSNKKN